MSEKRSWDTGAQCRIVSVVCLLLWLQAFYGQQGTCKSITAVPKKEITQLSGQGYQLVAAKSATALMQVKAGATAHAALDEGMAPLWPHPPCRSHSIADLRSLYMCTLC